MEVEAYMMPKVTFWLFSIMFLGLGFLLGIAFIKMIDTEMEEIENG